MTKQVAVQQLPAPGRTLSYPTLAAPPPTDTRKTLPDQEQAPDPATSSGSESAASDEAAPAASEDGAPEARYTVLGVLGAGGMGEVRLCHDRRIGREVAMKITHATLDEPPLRARLLQEAHIQAQLGHPSIVPVYDIGVDSSGAPYFTMKRVHGVTLANVLRRLRARDAAAEASHTRRRLLAAFAGVCRTLHYAHTHGIIHRDLTPTNIMLGELGELYVLDWGVARVLNDEVAPAPLLLPPRWDDTTAPGDVIGTPGYIAPEQIRGEPIDARADVYSLGTVLFQILALEPLHSRDVLVAVARTLGGGVDARPSVRAPEQAIPAELDAICVRATAFAAEDRYASAREIADAVVRFLEGERAAESEGEGAGDGAGEAERGLERRPESPRAPALSANDPVTLPFGAAPQPAPVGFRGPRPLLYLGWVLAGPLGYAVAVSLGSYRVLEVLLVVAAVAVWVLRRRLSLAPRGVAPYTFVLSQVAKHLKLGPNAAQLPSPSHTGEQTVPTVEQPASAGNTPNSRHAFEARSPSPVHRRPPVLVPPVASGAASDDEPDSRPAADAPADPWLPEDVHPPQPTTPHARHGIVNRKTNERRLFISP